jgi:hypothetical protein
LENIVAPKKECRGNIPLLAFKDAFANLVNMMVNSMMQRELKQVWLQLFFAATFFLRCFGFGFAPPRRCHPVLRGNEFFDEFPFKLPLRRKKTLRQPLPNAQTNGQNDAFLSILVEFSLIASYFHLISAKSKIAEMSRF